MSCKRLGANSRFEVGSYIDIPKHPDALTRGYYLLQEPYSTYYLDFPPFGAISLPANDLVDMDKLYYTMSVDAITGRGRLDIGPHITQIQGQVGVPIALAQNSPDLSTAIQTVASNAVGGGTTGSMDPQITGGNTSLGRWINHLAGQVRGFMQSTTIGQTVTSTASNIISALVATTLPVQVIGGNGGFMSSYYAIKLVLTYATLVPDNNTEWGRPLCQTKTLNTIPGYILCADADFEISCTEAEREGIAGFLTSGFYYE